MEDRNMVWSPCALATAWCLVFLAVCNNLPHAQGAVLRGAREEASKPANVSSAMQGVRKAGSRKLASYTCEYLSGSATCGIYPYTFNPYPGCCTDGVCTGYYLIGDCSISCVNPAARLACCDGYDENFDCNASPSQPSAPSQPSPTQAPATRPPATLPPATLPPATLPPATLPPATLSPATLPPATLPPATVPKATAAAPTATLPPKTTSITTPTATAAPLANASTTSPPPSLEPKAGDVVITSAFAVGSVRYTCSNPVLAEFDNISMSAILYTATGQPTGNFTYNNGTQTFILTTGKAVIGPADKGATYPVPNNALTDGDYGSLDVGYSSASGSFGLKPVTAITFTQTNGGVLPENAPCTALPFPTEVLPPWYVPFQANFTFFNVYTPPV